MVKKFLNWYDGKSISTKITLLCSIVFITLIAIINFVVLFGVSYALFYPAEATIQYGKTETQKILNTFDGDFDNEFFNSLRKNLIAGVVLRIYEDDNLVFDTNKEFYPTEERFNDNIVTSPPLFADNNLEMSAIKNALIYRSEIEYEKNSKTYTFYFYRTITSQKNIFDELRHFMLFADFLAIILSIMISRFISRKVLDPVKGITELARKIAAESERENVKERIPLPTANDEITELAKTFNTMLDRVQGDISTHKNFVSNASHELRKPLTIIKGYVEILEKYSETDIELRDESLEAIRDETQNIQNLLKSLRRDFKNLEDSLNFNKELFNLAEIVNTIFQRENTTTSQHKVSLIHNDDAQIYGDKTAILQMLRIFVDNAIKYTPQGGKIILSSFKRGDKVLVSIADTGIGIAAENFDKIFERGVRLTEDKFVQKAEGSGIGLAMAKTIADGHDIEIDMESVIGEGTTFTLSIPLAK